LSLLLFYYIFIGLQMCFTCIAHSQTEPDHSFGVVSYIDSRNWLLWYIMSLRDMIFYHVSLASGEWFLALPSRMLSTIFLLALLAGGDSHRLLHNVKDAPGAMTEDLGKVYPITSHVEARFSLMPLRNASLLMIYPIGPSYFLFVVILPLTLPLVHTTGVCSIVSYLRRLRI